MAKNQAWFLAIFYNVPELLERPSDIGAGKFQLRYPTAFSMLRNGRAKSSCVVQAIVEDKSMIVVVEHHSIP